MSAPSTRTSKTSGARSSRILDPLDTFRRFSGWATASPSRRRDERALGAAASQPAAVVAGRPILAADPALGPRALRTASLRVALRLHLHRRHRLDRGRRL